MPSLHTFLTFAIAGVALVVVPGPSVLFIVGRALTHGRRAALTTVAGHTTGVAVVVLVVAFGFGAIAAGSAVVFMVLKLGGAAYLIWLGIQTIRRRGDLVVTVEESAAPARLYRQAVLVGATNPKVLILFAAILPQFVDPAAGSATTQMLVLGLVFALLAAGLDAAWGLAAGAARDWFATSPARLRRVGATGGVLLIGLGAGLAVTRQGT